MFLECVTHPPELFYNDPRSHSFDVVLALRNGEGIIPSSEGQNIEIQILYERGDLVDNQDILEYVDNPGRVKLHESTAFRFRINQVSRNHLNRRFRLRFKLQGQYSDVKIETDPVMVLSKEASKRSRGKKSKDGSGANKRAKTARKSTAKSDKWITQACDLFKDIAWQRAGYEFMTDASGQECVDKSSPIFRCVCCGAMAGGRNQINNGAHQPNCALNSLLSSQNLNTGPPTASVASPSPSSPSPTQQLRTTDSSNSMAQDLQDILNIPASSFTWLEQELADEDELLSQYSVGEDCVTDGDCSESNALELIRQQSPSLIR